MRHSNPLMFWLLLSLCGLNFKFASATTIDLLGVEELPDKQLSNFRQWTQKSLQAVENRFGPLPQKTLPILLNTKFFASEPVPWGEVRREHFPSQSKHIDGLYLVTYKYAKPKQLLADWTLYHEISHLYLPYLNYSSFWMSEGFATYAQNLVMLQDGVISRERFINNLIEGLERGKQNWRQTPGPLSEVTDNMRALRAFKRVYWTGTAFFIEADIALQKRNQSIPDVIQRYAECCITADASGIELAKTLDKIVKAPIFTPLYLRYQQRMDFPKIAIEEIYQLAYFYQPSLKIGPAENNSLKN